jgi:hypothetical protein
VPDHWTDEDWIGQVGLLAIDPRDEPGSHEVRFERPVEDPVVLASVRSAGEGGPAAPAIRAVGETGFEVRIDPWDEAEPGEGTLSWIALSEGRHELADGRVVEAGSTTLASPGAERFEPGPVAPAPPSPAAATAPPERWSDPATWGGAPPGPGDTVRIPAGRTVLLDADATVAGIEVGGTLLVEDARDIALETDWMLLRGGDFRVGSPEDPFEHDFTLTLSGDDPGLDLSLDGLEIVDDTAFLMAMGEDARLEMHGAEATKAAWTRLSATAPAGAREIRLAEAPGWEAGDRIAVAPTDFDPREAETARIEAVLPDGRTLTLDRPLAHAHFGELQSFSNGERTWTLDTRAEVGLLSRNIRIEGDAESPEDGLGGHVMAMAGAEMRLSGVELAHMGQAGEPGRYPVHWHMTGDASGQYIRDSAIHHSHNRAVTLHGTQFARVENTVAYDIVGHAYFLEDGSETGNRLEGNLGMLTRAAESAAEAVIPTDHSHVSTFWISNPDNVFLGNVAAGSDHAGFWFLAGDGVTGPSADREAYADIVPRTAPLARFEGNAAHSNQFANLAFDGHADPDTLAFVESEYRPERTPVIRDFTSSKSLDRGIWIRAGAMDLHDVKAADNARATFFSYNQTLHDSLIVGRSANTGTPETPREIAAGRTLPEPYEGRYFRGHSIYDGPSGVIDTHFANFTREDAAIQTQGAAQKSPAHFVSGLSFANVPGRGRVDFSAESGLAHMWSSGLIDLDGSLTGRAGATLTPILETAGGESGFNAPPDAATRPVWGARQTSEAPGPPARGQLRRARRGRHGALVALGRRGGARPGHLPQLSPDQRRAELRSRLSPSIP